MTDSDSAALSVVATNERSLQTLIRAIAFSQGQFALILVRCNYERLREQMLLAVRERCPFKIDERAIPSSVTTLHHTLLAALGEQHPPALMVLGLESVQSLDELLSATNQMRDEFRQSFPFPLVLWITDEVLQKLTRLASDFRTWAAAAVKFELATVELLAFLQQEADSLFARVLEAGVQDFWANATCDLDSNCQHRWELECTLKDLQQRGVSLEPELEASTAFVLGCNAYTNDAIDDALVHYQRSLAFWQNSELDSTQNDQELGGKRLRHHQPPLITIRSWAGSARDTNSRSQRPVGREALAPTPAHNLLLKKGMVLFQLGLCCCRKAELHPSENRRYWEEARYYLQQCVEDFEQAQRPDIVAKFISPLCEVLQRLEAWADLQQLAQQSLVLHQIYGTRMQLAQDYGFKAAVVLRQFKWLEAYHLAQTALSILQQACPGEVEVRRYKQHQGLYLLLLASSQRQLGDSEAAVNNLERARLVCEPQYDPSLILEILAELRSLHFEHHNYLEAFKIKQAQLQIEKQYGLRAFIGAGQLQPQHYSINSVQPQNPLFTTAVAQEIAASGRQQDVNRLIERMSRADRKLTVIHGPSGVGKSSILKAGLVPSLHRRVIGDRISLPVVLSTYTDWTKAIERALAEVTDDLKLEDETSNLELSEAEQLNSKIRNVVEDCNRIIVLIFDQFEEFFFINTQAAEKLKFYEFLRNCLNLPFVKVILSLREDYLHYLLEFNRYTNLAVINNNILDKDIRYYIGNFSSTDAFFIIQSLTERSQYKLSQELIHELVQDLAGELSEVHPIELQIVGAQLQAEKIATLEQYRQRGPKQKLVERWLEQVIQDCGAEHEQLSWKVLFELTDEKGTRPLKTKQELAAALPASEGRGKQLFTPHPSPDRLDLILEILVGSGLVFRVREESGIRYQLVHDYLVQPICKKDNSGLKAQLQLSQQHLQERNRVLKWLLNTAVLFAVASGSLAIAACQLAWRAEMQRQRADQSETAAQISALTAASEALFASNKEFDALLESLRAWRQLKQVKAIDPQTRMRVVTALQQSVYGVTETNRLEGHKDIVWGVSFSPKGQLLATASRDKTVKLWRRDGRELQTLQGHTDSVTSVSFSPNGQLLASASWDKTVKLWHKDSTDEMYRLSKTLVGHQDCVYSVSFSPDGQTLATAGRDKTIKLWRSDGRPIATLRGHSGSVNWVSFSPDGQLLASASDDKTVKLWRLDGRLVATLVGHQDWVLVVAFSPDGQTVASAGRDKTIKLWRRAGTSEVYTVYKNLRQHSSAVWGISFSPNRQQLASASNDNTVKIWNLNSGTLLKTFKGHSDSVTSVSFSPDNQLLASASYDKTVKLWNLDAAKPPILEGHTDRVQGVRFSPDGQLLASASYDKTVRLWRRDSRGEFRLYKTLLGHTARVNGISFHPNGQILASASADHTVKLWSLNSGTLLKTLRSHSNSVTSVSFSPDGQLLASASRDQTVKLWRDGTLLQTLVEHKDWVNSVAWSPDSQLLASASDDKTVKIWRSQGVDGKYQIYTTLLGHNNWILDVSFSPTAQVFASASWDNTVKLWRKDGTLLDTLLKGYSDSVNSVIFNPSGQILAAASWDSTVKLWSLDGKLLKTLNGHRAPVLGVSFSPDGKTLASASADHTVILWNLDLDNLVVHACDWVGDYLKNNPNANNRDRHLCDGIATPHYPLPTPHSPLPTPT